MKNRSIRTRMDGIGAGFVGGLLGFGLFVGVAGATTLTVFDGTSDDRSFSWIHAASGGAYSPGNGNVFYLNGTQRAIEPTDANPVNTFVGTVDLANQSLTISGGTVDLGGGGTLRLDGLVNFAGATEGDFLGSLDYWITGNDMFGTQQGSFYFYYYNFSGTSISEGPNNMFTAGQAFDIQLTGNNWNGGDPNGGSPIDSFDSEGARLAQTLGMDLRVVGAVQGGSVPDSGTTVIFLGLALTGMGAFRRWATAR